MRKYLEVFKFELKSQMNFKANFIFSLFSFSIHIFVFSQLWDYMLKDKLILGYSKPELIWYIIIGEFLMYTVRRNYNEISDMVKNGDIANMLVKPIDFVKYIFAKEFTCVVNCVVNAIFGVVLGLLMAGTIEMTIPKLLIFAISMLLAIVIMVSIQVFVGLLAFLTEETSSFFIILQKFMLLLVFSPLEFYPTVLQNIFRFLPTTYTVYAPAKIFVHFELNEAILLVIGQILSIVALFAIINLIAKKGVKKINVNGG